MSHDTGDTGETGDTGGTGNDKHAGGLEPRPMSSRRHFLKLGVGAIAVAGGGIGLARQLGAGSSAIPSIALPPLDDVAAIQQYFRLVATDGFVSLPGRRPTDAAGPVYMFGFRGVPDADLNARISRLSSRYKGKVTNCSPIIGCDEGADVYITLTNVGLQYRPDLDDSHTIHFHGFPNGLALFDGVPETGIAVPEQRNFPYFFRARDPGTYMYHCHFEDVEHVQMGMAGLIFIRPAQNAGTASLPAGKYVYNDGDGSTGYDREFALLLNEIDPHPHDGLLAVQEFAWTNYDPSYWLINGRCYPDTLLPNNEPSLPGQPFSSLIQAVEGERVALRIANLGYQHHTMQLNGVELRVVGADAHMLRGHSGADLTWSAESLDLGPGESRDAIFVAPPHQGPGPYDTYLFRNRSSERVSNGGQVGPNGLGGMCTEVRVYPTGSLPPQTAANQLF